MEHFPSFSRNLRDKRRSNSCTLEVETENNILVDGTVTVVFIDLNGDGKVNIRDIAMVAVHFGEYLD